MSKEIQSTEKEKLNPLKAAYALNMCTVSVSQIVQYNDLYILEQEYNAILNNLNLEEMPKDQALLDILTQILNTITYFRIQEIKKKQIEQKYQQQMKDAIWSAIPNLGVIVTSGHPVAIATSLATQIGSGYMNYRKTKAQASRERDKENVELEITAIEQFNALRRELFTTAWRLADRYNFEDRYRLTENQIEQYNAILMDLDEVRKYERLEAIQAKFGAYLPFWYNFGHTAAYIAGTKGGDQKEYYLRKAKEHFAEFYRLYKDEGLKLLREDQIVASYALEYADLLMPTPEEAKLHGDEINNLLDMARDNAGNANDMLQLCAIGYLKVGNHEKAAELLKFLVNEDYNTPTNAKLLSRLYVVSALVNPNNSDWRAKYNILRDRVNGAYLFPMPEVLSLEGESALNDAYVEQQKKLLLVEYRGAYQRLIRQYMIKANRMLFPDEYFRQDLPDDSCFDNTEKAKRLRREAISRILKGSKKEVYMQTLETPSLGKRYIDLLNTMLSALDELSVFCVSPKKYHLIKSIRKKFVVDARPVLLSTQNKLHERSFSVQCYDQFCDSCSYTSITRELFQELDTLTVTEFQSIKSWDDGCLDKLNRAETELLRFCNTTGIEFAELSSGNIYIQEEQELKYLPYDIMGSSIADEEAKQNLIDRLIKTIKKFGSDIVKTGDDMRFLVSGLPGFDDYFEKYNINKDLKTKTLAVMEDNTKANVDLLLTLDGIQKVTKGKLTGQLHVYANAKLEKDGIRLDRFFVFNHKSVENGKFIQLIRALDDELKK